MEEQKTAQVQPVSRDDQARPKFTTDIPPKVLKALGMAQIHAEHGKATKPATDGQLSFIVFSIDDVMRVAKPAFKKAGLAIIPVRKWLRARPDMPHIGQTTVVLYAVIADDECAFCEIEAPIFGDPSRELSHRVAGANTYAKKKWYEELLGLTQEDPNLPIEPNGPVYDTRGSYLAASPPPTPAPPQPATLPTPKLPPSVARGSKKREPAEKRTAEAPVELPEALRPHGYEAYQRADRLSPRMQDVVRKALTSSTYVNMDQVIALFTKHAPELGPEEDDIARTILFVRTIEVHCATHPGRLLSDWNELHRKRPLLSAKDFEHLKGRLAKSLKESEQPVPESEFFDIDSLKGEE